MRSKLHPIGKGLVAVPLLLTLLLLSCTKDDTTLAPFAEGPQIVLAGAVHVDGVGPAAGVAVTLEPVWEGLPASVWRALARDAGDVHMSQADENGSPGEAAKVAGAPTRVTTTDGDGRFVFTAVAPGAYVVTSTARDHRAGAQQVEVPEPLNAAAAETTFVDIALVPTGTLTGWATLVNETAHGGTVVYVENQANVAVTGPTGRYILRDVPLGVHPVRAQRSGWRTEVRSGTLAAAGDSVEVAGMLLQPELNLPPTAAIAASAIGNTRYAFALNGSGTDPDGTIVRYEWDFDDDGEIDWSSPTTGATTHVYTQGGFFRAKLRVVDDKGGVGLAAASFTIHDAYFVATDGSDTNPGTRELPVRTIGKGLGLAAANGDIQVRVALGTYTEALELPNRCWVKGGYRRSDWVPTSGRSIVETGPTPLKAVGLTAASIQQLEVRAPNSTTGSSIALVVDNCASQDVEFVYCRFAAGNGAAGTAGIHGAAGGPGDDGEDGGWPACYARGGESHLEGAGGVGGAYTSPPGNGGAGGPGASYGTPGGSGGAGGIAPAGDGGNGTAGAWGTLGFHGAPAGSGGTWSLYSWRARSGDDGSGGGRGAQGGGGGGGAAILLWTDGGGGGEGGWGGYGGSGGGEGVGGGGSFAVLIAGTTDCLFTACDFESANGGAGGAGGNGGVGGAGGNGGEGADCSSTTAGGVGGNGGPGGNGGGAGGGSGGGGGWTYAIYARSGADFEIDQDCTTRHGLAGTGGLGGLRGGGTSRAPSGPAGQAGYWYREP